ncbi:MAG: helix-turn-helix domain-containing protein [Desulfobacterales bacterium]|nr:helix-turn-helix domain-containing protein [Desulfobacterales bacterium]
MGELDRNFVNSLAKGLRLLMHFSKEQPNWSLTQIAKVNDMNLPTTRRYLHTLTKLGFMIKDEPTKTFQLTPKVLRLGSWIIGSMGIKERLLPYMTSIRNEWDVTTHCAIIEGKEIVNVERIRSSDVVNLDLSAGSRLPLHATSMGKAILAFMSPAQQKEITEQLDFKSLTPYTISDMNLFLIELEKTKQRGFAIAVQELSLGLKTMATPVFNSQGIVEASFGVSYPLTRAQENGFEEALIKRLFEIRENA